MSDECNLSNGNKWQNYTLNGYGRRQVDYVKKNEWIKATHSYIKVTRIQGRVLQVHLDYDEWLFLLLQRIIDLQDAVWEKYSIAELWKCFYILEN